MKNKLIVFIVVSLIALISCNQDDNNSVNTSLALDGDWWLVGHYSDGDSINCGDRGPWNAHMNILQSDFQVQLTSTDIDGGPYDETILLDNNYNHSTSSSTTIGNVTETHARTVNFLSSSTLTGSSTVTRDDGINRCQTISTSTGIKLESAHLDSLANSYCLTSSFISTDVNSPEYMQATFQLYPTNRPDGIDFITTGGSIQFSGSGNISDEKILLSGSAANGFTVEFVLAFASDSTKVIGSVLLDLNQPEIAPLTGSITGFQGSCWQQTIPQSDMTDIGLPMSPLENIIDFQVFDLDRGHDGIDFKPEQSLLPVYSPISGLVTSLTYDYPHNGTLVQSVRINYNEDYYVAINFEPYTDDILVASLQKNNITVQLMQHINKGDVIGYLVVPGNTGFPHIHWGVGLSSSATTLCPSNFLSVTERINFENYVTSIEGNSSCP